MISLNLGIVNLLPVPVHYETLSGKLVSPMPQIVHATYLSDMLTPSEIGRLRTPPTFIPQGYILKISDMQISIFSASSEGKFRAMNTLDKIVKASKEGLPNVLVLDYPAFAVRGFMEGFTGYPWTHHRAEMIEKCARFGFNSYVLGPNEFDLLLAWKKEFSKEYSDHLGSVASAAAANHVKFGYKLIPFKIDMSSKSDVEAFKRKVKELFVVSQGFDG